MKEIYKYIERKREGIKKWNNLENNVDVRKILENRTNFNRNKKKLVKKDYIEKREKLENMKEIAQKSSDKK